MRQLGNAVPMTLGHRVAASVAEHLLNEDLRNTYTAQMAIERGRLAA